MLFEGGGDGGLAACREPREPDREAALFAEEEALVPREGGVPCYVAVWRGV